MGLASTEERRENRDHITASPVHKSACLRRRPEKDMRPEIQTASRKVSV